MKALQSAAVMLYFLIMFYILVHVSLPSTAQCDVLAGVCCVWCTLYAVHILAVYLFSGQPTFLPCRASLGPSSLPVCYAPPGCLFIGPCPAVQPGSVLGGGAEDHLIVSYDTDVKMILMKLTY